jgi:hypothetical protein
MVHIDPENDEATAKCRDLPLRSELLRTLNHEWKKHDVLKNIDDITLHYLDGKVYVEACIALKNIQHLEDIDTLKQEFNLACKKITHVGDSQLHFR